MGKVGKVMANIYVLSVAVFPLVFTFGVGYVEQTVRRYALSSFEPRYLFITLITYIVSGAFLAFIGVTGKKYPVKVMLSANISAVIVGLLGCVMYYINTIDRTYISSGISNFIHNNFKESNILIAIGFAAYFVVAELVKLRKKA